MSGELKITLIKSTIGQKPPARKTIEALGLRKLNSFVTKKDNPATRGMINVVSHLVKVEKLD